MKILCIKLIFTHSIALLFAMLSILLFWYFNLWDQFTEIEGSIAGGFIGLAGLIVGYYCEYKWFSYGK